MRLPAGWHTVTPRIVADDVPGLIEFMKRAFGATGNVETDKPSVIRIGDSMLMVSGTGPRRTAPAFLYVYVEDADMTFARALAAGATGIEQPFDTPYGDRRAMVEDRWHNLWQIATHK